MTLYYDDETDSIIENHPNFAEFDDDGRLVLHMDELDREEKRKSLLDAAVAALEASDEYELTTEPETRWVPEDERDD